MSTILDLGVAAATFAVIFPAELPDKTLVATLVLSTRFRPLPVWLGVSAAFGIQCLVAVTFAGLLTLLPRGPVLLAAGALFAVGSVLMFRGAGGAVEELAEEEREIDEIARSSGAAPRDARRAFLTSFLVLFAAEWGDLSQLVTAGLAVRYADPVSVFVGSWLALCTIAAVATLAGRQLAQRLPIALIRRIAGVVLAVIAVITLIQAVRAFG